MELLSRLEEIFYDNLNRLILNLGYRLYRALVNFCSIAMADEIPEENLFKLDTNVEYLLAACKELDSDELEDWAEEQEGKEEEEGDDV